MPPVRVAAVAALLSLTLAASALVPGPERPIAPPSYGPAYGTQFPQALATDGTDFLSVWLDQQPGRDGLYAAVVTKNGVTRPLPPRPIVRGYAVTAQAVWVGDAYLLLWFEPSKGAIAARISRDGELLSAPVVIAPGYSPLRSIAWNGHRALVLLSRNEGDNALLLDASARVVRDDLFIGTHDPSGDIIAVAAGDDFVVATRVTRIVETPNVIRPYSTVRLSRISSDGDREDSRVLVQDAEYHAMNLSVAADGNRVGIAYVHTTNYGSAPTKLMRFVVDAGTLSAISTAPPVDARGSGLQVVAAQGDFAAGSLEYDGSTLSLVTLPFAGSSSWSATPLGPTFGVDLLMVSSGSAVTAVWRDDRLAGPQNGYMQVFGIALDAAAKQATRNVAPVSWSALAQKNPVIASASSVALMAWVDLSETIRGNVMVARVDSAGRPIDPQPTIVGTRGSSWIEPAVVFTGRVWIVAWTENVPPYATRSFMRRVARDGTLLDVAPVEIPNMLAFASNRTVTLMVTGMSGGFGVVRFSPDGERLDAQPHLVAARSGHSAALASNGSEFLLAWVEGSDYWQFPSPNMRDVHALRLDANGLPIASVIDVATSADDEAEPRIASDGEDFLVAWQNLRDSYTIRAKRVLRAGALADTTASAAGTVVGDGHAPFAIAPLRDDGYVVSFTKTEDGGASSTRLVAVDTRGTPIGAPRVVGDSEAPPSGCTVATLNGSPVVAYTRTAPEPEYANIVRVFVRRVTEEIPRRRAVRR